MNKFAYLTLLISSFSFAQSATSHPEFNSYWYGGKAEITSYTLEQARYGEMRKGHALNIFVTEPFSKEHNTKADGNSSKNTSVLKLNATKKFNTGIYPYSIMTSTFIPISNPKNSVKISSSTQEWCGHEYIELVDQHRSYELNNFSYFQGESFKNKYVTKETNLVLEDDIWSKIRIIPNDLPQGEFMALPSFVYLRFSHNEVKTYKAQGKLTKGSKTNTYEISYPSLDRKLSITFENTFPYKITNWMETYYSGWGAKRQLLTTKATLKKSLNIAYWQTNKNKDSYLRKELGID